MASGTIERPLNNNVEFVYANIGFVSGETNLQKMQRAVSQNYIPKNKAFVGTVLSGSYFWVSGFVYLNDNKLYGSFNFGSYNEAKMYYINDGVWTASTDFPVASFANQITTTHTKAAGFGAVKSNNVCTVTLAFTLTSAVSSYGTIATIPDGYRPNIQVIGSKMDITAGGNIRSLNSMGSGSSFTESFTYIV